MNRKRLILAGALMAALAVAWATDFHRYLLHRVLVSGNLEGYQVTFSADDMYAVKDFSLPLEFSELNIPVGILVPGTTSVGTTVVLILGDGEWRVRDPGQYRWARMLRDSTATPFTESFTSLYLRIHPNHYDELIGSARLTPLHDTEAFARAERIYRHKFWNSYHANERALIPSRNIGTVDMESQTWGRLLIHEGVGIGAVGMPPTVEHWDYQGDPPWYMD